MTGETKTETYALNIRQHLAPKEPPHVYESGYDLLGVDTTKLGAESDHAVHDEFSRIILEHC